MKKAPFLSLNYSDLIKGLITAFLTSVLTGIVAMLSGLINSLQGGAPVNYPSLKIQLLIILLTGIVSGSGYILKNIFTNSDDKFAVKEPSKEPQVAD